MTVNMRWLIRRDFPEVLDIENRSCDDPWDEDEFKRLLRERNCMGMIAERNCEVVGFMMYELRKQRMIVLNFAVHPDHRRSGVGRAMAAK